MTLLFSLPLQILPVLPYKYIQNPAIAPQPTAATLAQATIVSFLDCGNVLPRAYARYLLFASPDLGSTLRTCYASLESQL